jgi:hypothetical protein
LLVHVPSFLELMMSHTKIGSCGPVGRSPQDKQATSNKPVSLRDCLAALKCARAFRNMSLGYIDFHARVNANGQRWPSLGYAQERARDYKDAARKSRRDAGYWGVYVRQQYWETVVALYQAADLTGDTELPSVIMPADSAGWPAWLEFALEMRRLAEEQSD